MAKQCPPGVICVENVTFLFFIIIAFICFVLYYVYKNNKPQQIVIQPQINATPPPQNETRGLPINIQTNPGRTSYEQNGILTRVNGPETILPLMGRQLQTNRNKWQYYTMSDTNNSIRLPISFNGKSCTDDYGCEELTNGDTVYVEGYSDAFKVTVYEKSNMQYIPYI